MPTRKSHGAYAPRNPKVDIFDKATGRYIASTRFHRTVRDAVAAATQEYRRAVVGRIDHDARVNPARPKRTKAACAKAGKNLSRRRSTRAGRALQACAPRDNPLPVGRSVWSVLYRDGDSGEALYAQVFARNAADARHAFRAMTQDAAHTVSRVVRGAPPTELRAGRTFAGRFSNPDNLRDNPSDAPSDAKVIGARTVSWTVRGATFRRRFLLLRQGGALDWIEVSPLGHLVGFVTKPGREPEMARALILRRDAQTALAAYVARRGSAW